MTDEQLEAAVASLHVDGYLKLGPLFTSDECARAANLVRTVTAAGFPPPFALVYDLPWAMLGRLQPVMSRVFGHEARLLPDFWLWQLDGQYERTGWDWHRDDKLEHDCFDESGHPLILTVWLTFTDATEHNGCIQVLPMSVDPSLAGAPPASTRPELLPGVRTVPADAGSVLAWNMAVLHRGGPYTERAEGPRISVGMYMQSSAVESFDGRAIRVDQSLPLVDRLGIVSRMITRYETYYPFDPELLAFCRTCAGFYERVSAIVEARKRADK